MGSLVKSAASILNGTSRPVDNKRRSSNRNGGRKPMYPPECMNCKAEPHRAKGLGSKCYAKWKANKTGPIQPYEPVYPIRGVQPCKEAPNGCTGMTGSGRDAHGWCAVCYTKWLKHGDPLYHSPNISLCRAKGCDHRHAGRGT